jgi:hypothetical protein
MLFSIVSKLNHYASKGDDDEGNVNPSSFTYVRPRPSPMFNEMRGSSLEPIATFASTPTDKPMTKIEVSMSQSKSLATIISK